MAYLALPGAVARESALDVARKSDTISIDIIGDEISEANHRYQRIHMGSPIVSWGYIAVKSQKWSDQA